MAVIGGMTARRLWNRLPDAKKSGVRSALKKRRGVLAGIGLACAASIALAYEMHVQECPITKRRKFVVLTPKQVGVELFCFVLKFYN